MEYKEFIKGKERKDIDSGFSEYEPHSFLFDFQKAIVKWAVKRGRAAIFADTGLGKTAMQLAWADAVSCYTGGNVLVIAPLCVAYQTVDEGAGFGINVHYCRSQDASLPGINITNYEMLDKFDLSKFDGVVLDESSILKHQQGKIRNSIIDSCRKVPYKLSCTATPSPNDFMELGSQCEFLGVMSAVEMLAMYFIHDGGETSKWRLKGHGRSKFWQWMASWACVIRRPSDIGFSDEGYILPKLHMHQHIVSISHDTIEEGTLFPMEATGLLDRNRARRDSVAERVEKCASIVGNGDDPWLVWCHLNDEGDALVKSISGAHQVSGSDKIADKESRIMGFTSGDVRCLVTKPKIAGFGMNWQHCNNMAFVGLSDSFEQFYQAVRRCYRFGQNKEVNVHVIVAETEGAVLANIQRKEKQAQEMGEQMVSHMKEFTKMEVLGMKRESLELVERSADGDGWHIDNGDCVEVVGKMDDGSVDYTIFSPPFASLYTYSNSERDMGNCESDDDFTRHFGYLVNELFRVTRSGRLVSFHCMNLPTSKVRDGYIGIKDFRGELIKLFQDAGFIFHSEVCIWKDPVTAMQRTKALGLLHKTIRKDSAMSRNGIPDYVVTMRKPGVNDKPIAHYSTYDDLMSKIGEVEKSDNRLYRALPVDLWQKYASPVWMDINPSNTLNLKGARDENDERHICPLQLDVIERCLHLWSAEGDTVLSPFTGIGSEGYMSVKMGRKFVGAELKPSYFNLACKNLASAEKEQTPLFSFGGVS